MKIGVKVGDLMTRNFIFASPNTNLKKCAEIMVKKRVGSLIIKNANDSLAGILTEKDILYAIVKKSIKELDKINAKDLMKTKVITIKPSLDISFALEKVKKDKVRRLPVVENGKIIGMLTLKDILKVEPSLYEMISETEKIREETEKLKRSELSKFPNKQDLCEECGQEEILYDIDGQWVCEKCYDSR